MAPERACSGLPVGRWTQNLIIAALALLAQAGLLFTVVWLLAAE
jgi:hypothetical protein